MPWTYYALSAAFLFALAIGSEEKKDSLPTTIFILVFVVFGAFVAIYVFVKQRSQFKLRHLLIAVTLVAVFAALYSWSKILMAMALGITAGGGTVAIFVLECIKKWKVEHGKSQD